MERSASRATVLCNLGVTVIFAPPPTCTVGFVMRAVPNGIVTTVMVIQTFEPLARRVGARICLGDKNGK